MELQLTDVIVRFSTHLFAGRFEAELSSTLDSKRSELLGPVRIILDLSQVRFIDIVSCQQLTSSIIAFRSRNWWPIIQLPKSKEVRDFWRFWGYPDAFKSATGVALSRLVLPIEHSMLDEEQTTYKPSSKIEIIYPGVISNKRSENFFGFFSEDVETNSPTLLAEREAESWGLKQVQDVLTRHLGSDADYVPSRIVFEALFNASKHPKATLLQSASWHQKFSEKVDGSFGDKDGFFTLMFWDNGKSILSTLTDAVKDGVDLREGYEGGYDKNYYIREKHLVSDLVSNDETINSADIGFDLDAPERLLVSALFPGVTSRPESIDPVEHSFSKHLAKVDVNLTKRGMGLYVLMNAVVDVLGGSVEFRTDRFHIRAKRLGPRNAKSHGADTKITVTRVPDVLPKFIGNLIVVRAPSKN